MPVVLRLFDDLLALVALFVGNASALAALYGIYDHWPNEMIFMMALLAVLDVGIAAKYFLSRPGRSRLNFDPDDEGNGLEPLKATGIPPE